MRTPARRPNGRKITQRPGSGVIAARALAWLLGVNRLASGERHPNGDIASVEQSLSILYMLTIFNRRAAAVWKLFDEHGPDC